MPRMIKRITYSRPDPKLREWIRDSDRIYYFHTECLRVCLHRHIDYSPEAWLVTCEAAGIVKTPLKERDLESAQTEAIDCVYDKLSASIRSLTVRAATGKG